MDTIAKRIKEALELRGMKQSELCEKTGIGKSSISTYLSGAYEPKQKNIFKIAKALNVSESWLMGNDVDMQRDEYVRFFSGVDNVEILTDEELTFINKYRTLDEKGKHALHTIMNMEFYRCNTEILAAHDRTDKKVSREDKKHDKDIMNNDEFWDK